MRDSTVVTGDSRGRLQFWDGELGVLTTTLEQHSADIFAIVVNEAEDLVFASGTDSKVTAVRKMAIPSLYLDMAEENKDSMEACSWVYTTAQRTHSHDVLSMALTKDSKGEPVLLSGGLDCKLCTYSLKEFGTCRQQWVLPTPSRNPVTCSMNAVGGGWALVRHR